MIVTANIITDREAQPEIGSNKVDKILMVVIKETGDKRIVSPQPVRLPELLALLCKDEKPKSITLMFSSFPEC